MKTGPLVTKFCHFGAGGPEIMINHRVHSYEILTERGHIQMD